MDGVSWLAPMTLILPKHLSHTAAFHLLTKVGAWQEPPYLLCSSAVTQTMPLTKTEKTSAGLVPCLYTHRGIWASPWTCQWAELGQKHIGGQSSPQKPILMSLRVRLLKSTCRQVSVVVWSPWEYDLGVVSAAGKVSRSHIKVICQTTTLPPAIKWSPASVKAPHILP